LPTKEVVGDVIEEAVILGRFARVVVDGLAIEGLPKLGADFDDAALVLGAVGISSLLLVASSDSGGRRELATTSRQDLDLTTIVAGATLAIISVPVRSDLTGGRVGEDSGVLVSTSVTLDGDNADVDA